MTTDETPRPTRTRRGGRKHRNRPGPAGNPDLCPTPHKIAHHTEGGAARHLAELEASGKAKPGDGKAPYPCQCGAWHVGHDRTKATRPVKGRPPCRDEAALLDVKLAQLVTLHGRRPGHPGRR